MTDVVATHRPELALQVFSCITEWPYFEKSLGRAVATIMTVDAVEAVQGLSDIRSTRKQKDHVRDLAATKLDSLELDALLALLLMFGESQLTRNKLAHWYIGISDDIPDGILLKNPRDSLEENALFQVRDSHQLRGQHVEPTADDPLPDLSKIYVYKMPELKRIQKDMTELGVLFLQLSQTIRYRPGDPQGHAELRTFPRFRSCLERLHKSDQTASET